MSHTPTTTAQGTDSVTTPTQPRLSDTPTASAHGADSVTTPPPPRLPDTPTAPNQGAGNKSSATIGGAVGSAVGLILTIVVIVIVRGRRNRGGYHQAEWFAMVFSRRRRRRQRPNLEVTALPITTVGPKHVAEKTRECRHQVDSPRPTVTDDQRAARSSPGPVLDGQSRGADSEVLAKLNMIMQSVARLEADRDRQEAPPDYTSNWS
ncbi:hypothetical protein PQX77_017750 [Marasmius sp. AFHP31]|nr:hypothetical protein PQX77_017750 [Marasmius sp. AFHP31]